MTDISVVQILAISGVTWISLFIGAALVMLKDKDKDEK